MNIAEKWKPDDIKADPYDGTDIKAVLRCKYQAEPAGSDVWKLPSQTIADRGGDCEDLSILAIKIWLNDGVVAPYMIIGEAHTQRGRIWHAVAAVGNDLFYDCRYRRQTDRIRSKLLYFTPALQFRLDRTTAAIILNN